MNIKNTIKLALGWLKNNPQILLTGLGVAASVATAVTSGKAHAKAVAADNGASTNLLDFTKRHWMTYIPAAASLGVAVFSILACTTSHTSSTRRWPLHIPSLSST